MGAVRDWHWARNLAVKPVIHVEHHRCERAPTAPRSQLRSLRSRSADGGPTHFERDTKSVKTTWNTVCANAGVKGATPKTLRHTMLTWLAERGVPSEQRQMLAGHAPQGTTAKNYEHVSPTYLREAVAEIDAFFDELAKHTKAHLRYADDTQLQLSFAA